MVEGRRAKQKTYWLDNIKSDTELNIQQMKEVVLDRIAQTALAFKVAKSWTQPNG